jgi:hypothetical protein
LFEKSISRPPLEFATMLVQELVKKGKKQREPKRAQRRGQKGNAGTRLKREFRWTLDTLEKDSSILNLMKGRESESESESEFEPESRLMQARADRSYNTH